MVNKSFKNAVLGSQPVPSRLMTTRLRTNPLNTTVVLVYAPISAYDDEHIEDFYKKQQDVTDKVEKKNSLIRYSDWKAKVGKDAQNDWEDFISASCNDTSSDREIHLLEFVSYNMMLSSALGDHKASGR